MFEECLRSQLLLASSSSRQPNEASCVVARSVQAPPQWTWIAFMGTASHHQIVRLVAHDSDWSNFWLVNISPSTEHNVSFNTGYWYEMNNSRILPEAGGRFGNPLESPLSMATK